MPSRIALRRMIIRFSSSSKSLSPARITSLALLKRPFETVDSIKLSKWLPKDIDVFLPMTSLFLIKLPRFGNRANFFLWNFRKITYNGLQICDVADLEALIFNLWLMFIRCRMFQIPLSPPYSQMCCYGLVFVYNILLLPNWLSQNVVNIICWNKKNQSCQMVDC